APYTGGRIKTHTAAPLGANAVVAPFTGARIETVWSIATRPFPEGRSLHGGADRNHLLGLDQCLLGTSLPSRGRGSKPMRWLSAWGECSVAPFTGARIETRSPKCRRCVLRSLPSRGRGSKRWWWNHQHYAI